MNRISLFLIVFLGFSGVFQVKAMDVATESSEKISALCDLHASLYNQLMERFANASTVSEDAGVLFCDFVKKTYCVIKDLSKSNGLTLGYKQDLFNRTSSFFQKIMQYFDRIALDANGRCHCVLYMKQIMLLMDTYQKNIESELTYLGGADEASMAENANVVDTPLMLDESDDFSERTSASAVSITDVSDESAPMAAILLSSAPVQGYLEVESASLLSIDARLKQEQFQRSIRSVKACVYAVQIINMHKRISTGARGQLMLHNMTTYIASGAVDAMHGMRKCAKFIRQAFKDQ